MSRRRSSGSSSPLESPDPLESEVRRGIIGVVVRGPTDRMGGGSDAVDALVLPLGRGGGGGRVNDVETGRDADATPRDTGPLGETTVLVGGGKISNFVAGVGVVGRAGSIGNTMAVGVDGDGGGRFGNGGGPSLVGDGPALRLGSGGGCCWCTYGWGGVFSSDGDTDPLACLLDGNAGLTRSGGGSGAGRNNAFVWCCSRLEQLLVPLELPSSRSLAPPLAEAPDEEPPVL